MSVHLKTVCPPTGRIKRMSLVYPRFDDAHLAASKLARDAEGEIWLRKHPDGWRFYEVTA